MRSLSRNVNPVARGRARMRCSAETDANTTVVRNTTGGQVSGPEAPAPGLGRRIKRVWTRSLALGALIKNYDAAWFDGSQPAKSVMRPHHGSPFFVVILLCYYRIM